MCPPPRKRKRRSLTLYAAASSIAGLAVPAPTVVSGRQNPWRPYRDTPGKLNTGRLWITHLISLWGDERSAVGVDCVCTKRRALRPIEEVIFCKERSPTMEVVTVGLDLGRDVFQVHGVTSDGTIVFNRSVRRRQLLKFFGKLSSSLVGIEPCGSAHHRPRTASLIQFGRRDRLTP